MGATSDPPTDERRRVRREHRPIPPGGRPRAGRPAVRRSLRGPLIALAAVAVLAVTVIGWGVARSSGGAGLAPGPVADVRGGQAPNPLQSLARRSPGDPLAMGPVGAPVVMIMWSDFQCPFCGQFARQTEPALIDRYVKHGTLRLEWRDFPYLGPQSMPAARAARAAGEQGAFWAYHDALYALKLPPNSGQLTDQRLTAVAAGLHLDIGRFTAAMQSQQVADAVAADFTQGQNLGITGTPAFLINGTPIMGAQPEQTFDAAIDHAVAQATHPSAGG